MVTAFLAPALLLYLGLLVFPAGQAFYISLFKTSGFSDSMQWVGLANYVALWNDRVFWLSLTNMLLILVVGGACVFGLAFVFTMLLSSGLWGKKLFRALIFMPNVIAVTAITTFWSFVFMPRYGLLTNVLKGLGLERWASVSWTAPENVFWAMLVGLVWVCSGFFTILILAGADKVPADLFEAARLEGANQWQIFRYVTVPMIWDVIVITMVLWCIQAIKIMEFPYAFGGPNISQDLYTPAIYLYIMGFGQREPVYALGYATAIGVAMLAVTIGAVLVLRAGLQREPLEF
ncbi:carbohydrate ABC transporter permease [Verminephrobacter aporrectodeae]|uniref:Sugar ABC transporter permease n=2 Tax=Verminephrobacter TaxID=364316 RepID=A0ABT3KRJ6_9BURK|nr:sugar ABC transporter permease [Verminephrobacter aporrectodeae]MCW5220106.1 sugar ABC transporter permease [Verminephrobacter aporrectodeae subsp. tuberculatae]MCW5255929.1 sugar ABC transporter permease [Verminephrobacter aporrectodeae subsp. tuberculatae]MCW5289394.1 sugar ABC transporter permease [Verminephrobacter aporrectodeae subsp. tuberculatae]MCW5320941.1 sugar ABC transporter permease [Verminephrobacter aporrectodeae subsp. tuberculatae]MCW8176876.1 sugar ABC transporter permease